MKLNIKKVARRIVPVVTAVMIVVSMAVSVSADLVSYNINDFILSTDVDGVNDLMTIVIPYENNSFSTYISDIRRDIAYGTSVYNAPIIADYRPSEMDYQVKNMTVAYLPLGNTGAASYFDIGSLPSSTVFTLKNIVLYFVHNGSGLRTHITQSFSVQYYDVNGTYLGTQWVDREYQFVPEILGTMSYNLDDVSFTLNKPTGAKYVKFRMLIKFNFLTLFDNFDYMTVDVGNFLFQMSITDADRQLLQENKELLDEVNQQLAEQGKTMDEILNGTPEQNEQISGAVGEMGSAGDKLGDLSDQMQVEHPDASNMNVSINSFIPETSLLAYTGPILAFWENDSLQAMLIIVLTLVLVSWVMFGKKG